MSVLIKGMEIPTSPVLFCIHPDGKVFADLEGNWREYKAIPVPDHGDLIDRDKLEKDIDNYIGGEESRSRFHHWVQVQNVVIPREKGAET